MVRGFKRKLITTETFGNAERFPVLYQLVDKLNRCDYKYSKRCIVYRC